MKNWCKFLNLNTCTTQIFPNHAPMQKLQIKRKYLKTKKEKIANAQCVIYKWKYVQENVSLENDCYDI